MVEQGDCFRWLLQSATSITHVSEKEALMAQLSVGVFDDPWPQVWFLEQ
jgi:hypothetical protein